MTINNNFIKNRELVISILKVATIYNATSMGWVVTKINNKTYELTKKIKESEIETYNNMNLHLFVERLVS